MNSFKSTVIALTERQGLCRHLGIQVRTVKKGEVSMSLVKREQVTQFSNGFHGGAISTLIDQAAGACASSLLAESEIAFTKELTVKFKKPTDSVDNILANALIVSSSSNYLNVVVEVIEKPSTLIAIGKVNLVRKVWK